MRLLAGLALAVVLAGCASTPAPGNAQMQGQWSLDGSASDDATARIDSAVGKAERELRRRAAKEQGSGAGPDGDVGTLGIGTGRLAPDFQQLRTRLLQILGSPRTLALKVQSDDLQIDRDNEPGRDYQPGDTITRYEEYGTAQLRTAWKSQAFVITERYTSGARLEERYALDGRGTLVYTRSLRDPSVGRIEIRSVYRRPTP